MKTQESRRVRDPREREAAFQERQARRQAMHRDDMPPATTPQAPARAPSTPAAPPRAVAAPRARLRPSLAPQPLPPRAPRDTPRGSLILIPFLILISLAAAGIAGYALSKEPATSNVKTEIRTMDTQLAQVKHTLAALQAQAASSATAGHVRRVNRNVAGLKKSVGGVQNAIVPLKAELSSLRVCLPQLQAEVAGIAAHAKQKGVTTVGLSPECSTFLGG